MSDLIEEALREHWGERCPDFDSGCLGCLAWKMVDELTSFRSENERLRAALELYRDAVRIDATMEGPKFMGANSSALKRAWDADRAALEGKR